MNDHWTIRQREVTLIPCEYTRTTPNRFDLNTIEMKDGKTMIFTNT